MRRISSYENIEAAIIKDVLALSEGENLHTVYYIDLNRNINWSRKSTIVKEMRDYWLTETQGRFIYFSVNQFADALESLEALCSQRENTESDEEFNISPVTAIITCCEQIDRDSDEYYRFESLLGRGKNCNLFFVLQFNEYLRYPFDVITNAILLPDRCNEGEVHSSSVLLEFLSHTQAAENGAKELMHTLIKKPLDSRLNLICINNEAVCFMPYIYDKKSLKK